jgi:HK97 gp10 family phage protein
MADISITIDIKGFDEFAKAFSEDLPNALKDAVSEALNDLRDQIEEETTSLVPVRTGALRDSIDISTTEDTLTAVAGMDYASFVDLGTRKMDAEPYFTEPIKQAFDDFEQTLEDKIQSSLDSTL